MPGIKCGLGACARCPGDHHTTHAIDRVQLLSLLASDMYGHPSADRSQSYGSNFPPALRPLPLPEISEVSGIRTQPSRISRDLSGPTPPERLVSIRDSGSSPADKKPARKFSVEKASSQTARRSSSSAWRVLHPW